MVVWLDKTAIWAMKASLRCYWTFMNQTSVSESRPVIRWIEENVAPLIRAAMEERPEDRNDSWSIRSNFLSQSVSRPLGFDFEAGRRDAYSSILQWTKSRCLCVGPPDIKQVIPSLYGSMHETGHGLYEQGRPRNQTSNLPDRLTD